MLIINYANMFLQIIYKENITRKRTSQGRGHHKEKDATAKTVKFNDDTFTHREYKS